MRSAAVVLAVVVCAAAAGRADAFDLTGTWTGTAKCTSLFQGDTFKFTDLPAVQITQVGREIGLRADYGGGNVNFYAGRAYDDAKKPDEKGEVALVACGTNSVAGDSGPFDELGRFVAKAKPGKVKATLKGVSYYSDPLDFVNPPNPDGWPEAGTCKWTLTRVDTTNPAGGTVCER